MNKLQFAKITGELTLLLTLLASLGLGKAQAVAPATQEQEAAQKAAEAQEAQQQEAQEQEIFLRLRDVEGQRHLQAATLTLRAPDGQQLDLVGAVHLAEAEYFAQLNEQFKGYEVLLFELIADESMPLEEQLKSMAAGQANEQILENGPEGQAFGMLKLGQVFMAKLFDLSFQTQEIDYLADNFVHADLSMQEFVKVQTEAKESISSAMAEKMTGLENDLELTQEKVDEIVQGLFRAQSLPAKHFLAEVLVGFTEALAVNEDTPESVLLQGRNQVVIDAVAEQLEAGKQKIGVYYGAAHLPHLLEEFAAQGYELESTQWLSAWKMDPLKEKPE